MGTTHEQMAKSMMLMTRNVFTRLENRTTPPLQELLILGRTPSRIGLRNLTNSLLNARDCQPQAAGSVLCRPFLKTLIAAALPMMVSRLALAFAVFLR